LSNLSVSTISITSAYGDAFCIGWGLRVARAHSSASTAPLAWRGWYLSCRWWEST
jgi:hypothetical protein